MRKRGNEKGSNCPGAGIIPQIAGNWPFTDGLYGYLAVIPLISLRHTAKIAVVTNFNNSFFLYFHLLMSSLLPKT